MRIAIFTETYFPYISGVVTHIATLRQNLEKNGHKVLIVTTDPKALKHYVKDGVLHCPAIAVKRIYGGGITIPTSARRMKLIEEFRPDILHIHTEFSIGLFGLIVANKLKLPIVYTLHTMYDDYLFYVAPKRFKRVVAPAAHFYFNKIANAATEVIGPSQKVAAFLQTCGYKKQINIVPNTVNLSMFLPHNTPKIAVENLRKKLGLNSDDFVGIFVGRLGEEKSIDTLVEHFTGSFGDDPRHKLLIVGDGPMAKPLAALIQQKNMQGRIMLLGRIEHENLPAYYHASNYFTTCSLSEMNSIAMLEAMASGLYCVDAYDELNADQIIAGRNGETFTTQQEFCYIVTKLGEQNADERATLRRTVVATTHKYGEQEFIAQILQIYFRAYETYAEKRAINSEQG